MAARPDYDPHALALGILGRPHGLSGELLLRAYNVAGGGLALQRLAALIIESAGQRRSHRLLGARPVNEGWLVRLEGIASREDAAQVTGAAVFVSRADLPPLEAGEFFVADLVGCAVDLEDGRRLGVVESLMWNGAQDVIVVRAAAGGAELEHLIPVVPEFVRAVDVPGRQVTVAWEPGLAAAAPERTPEPDDRG